MVMFTGYSYPVESIEPSGLIGTSSGKLSVTRQFKLSCKYAESFALRMMGKWRGNGDDEIYDVPEMPAPYPAGQQSLIREFGYFNLLASDFSIRPTDATCFNNASMEGGTFSPRNITDPADLIQMEKYWLEAVSEAAEPANDGSAGDCGCMCIVTIIYTESPCDCWHDIWNDFEGLFLNILANTCVSTERNPSYEMYTLPNRTLYWAELVGDRPDGMSDEDWDALKVDKQLKGDSYAYQIIPKADITVSWHFVPVKYLCFIETHLTEYRGQVNKYAWGSVLNCNLSLDGTEADPDGSSSGSGDVCLYEPETLLFVDYAEDRSRRTTGFIGMDTTTLKLTFKQKRIIRPEQENSVVGWNHLFTDRNRQDQEFSPWQRVGIDVGGGSFADLFPMKDFIDILNPTLP